MRYRLITVLLLSFTLSSLADETASTAEKAAVPTEEKTVAEKVLSEEKVSPLAKGRALHEEHCTSCHAAKNPENPTGLYTRQDRKVSDYKGLKTQIQRCVTQLGLLWFEEDVAYVATYLNNDYYHFELEPSKIKE